MSQLCMLYPGSKIDDLLDNHSLEYLILLYRHGWEAKEAEAKTFWNVLCQAFSDKDDKGISKGIEKFKESHPDGIQKDGAWVLSR